MGALLQFTEFCASIPPSMATDKHTSECCEIFELQVLVKCQDSKFPLPQIANVGNIFSFNEE